MNGRLTRYALLLLLPLGVVSCGTEETESPSEVAGERTPVAFTTSLGAVTRATTIDNVWSSGDAIAVSNGSNTYEYTAEATSTPGGSVNLTFTDYDNQFSWPTTDPKWTFKAWYPYGNGTLPTAVNLNADQRGTADDTPADEGALTSDAFREYDLLYAETVSTWKKRVHLMFYHQMVHVVLKATVSAKSGSATEKVARVLLGDKNIAVKGNIAVGTTGSSVATPTARWTVASADKTNTVMMRHTATADNVHTFECLLPEQSIGNAETPLLTIITTDGSKLRTYLYKALYTFVAGYEYTFNMTINELGVLKVETFSIESWGIGTNGTGIVK